MTNKVAQLRKHTKNISLNQQVLVHLQELLIGVHI